MIASMERVEILSLLDLLPDVIEVLQEHGGMHVEEVPLAVEEAPRMLRRVHLSEAQKADEQALGELHRMLREIAPLLAGEPDRKQTEAASVELAGTAHEVWRRKARRWSRDIRSLVRRKSNVRENIELVESYHEMLGMVAPLLSDRGIRFGRGSRALVLKGEVSQAGSQLEKRLRRAIGADCQFFHQHLDRHTLVGIILHPAGKSRAVERLLHDEGIAHLELPDKELEGKSLPEVLARVEENLVTYRADLAAIESEIARFSQATGAELRAMLMSVSDRLAQLHVTELLARTELAGVIHGWIPANRVPALEQVLAERFPGQVYLGRLSKEQVDRKSIPILLENPSPLEPFEVLLSLLKPPTYGSMDPSAMVGIFFVFFYGFILGDIAYGLVVIGLSIWMRRRWGHNDTVRAASAVASYAGVSAVFFGIIFGEFCGDLGTRLVGMQPIWFHRGHDVLTLLYAALIIGSAHISLAMTLAIWSHFRRGDSRHVFEQVGMFLGLVAVGAVVLGVMTALPLPAMLIVGGVLGLGCVTLIIYASGPMAFVPLFELVSLVSNVLSYSRLMALGIASVALADLANRLADMAGNPFVGVPVALGIHLLNLAMGMFSPTLHALRLNYVEFLPKFYVPEGRKYVPFRKEVLL